MRRLLFYLAIVVLQLEARVFVFVLCEHKYDNKWLPLSRSLKHTPRALVVRGEKKNFQVPWRSANQLARSHDILPLPLVCCLFVVVVLVVRLSLLRTNTLLSRAPQPDKFHWPPSELATVAPLGARDPAAAFVVGIQSKQTQHNVDTFSRTNSALASVHTVHFSPFPHRPIARQQRSGGGCALAAAQHALTCDQNQCN